MGIFPKSGTKKIRQGQCPKEKKIFLQETFLNLTEPLHIKGAPPAEFQISLSTLEIRDQNFKFLSLLSNLFF